MSKAGRRTGGDARISKRTNFTQMAANLMNPAEGGFSVDPHTGEGPGSHGVMISRGDLPGMHGSPAYKTGSPRSLKRFASENMDTLGGGTYMGGWNEGGGTSGEIDVEHSERHAPGLGVYGTLAATNEKAGYNLATGKDVLNYEHSANPGDTAAQTRSFKRRGQQFLSGLD